MHPDSPLARLQAATRAILEPAFPDHALQPEVTALRDALFDAQPEPVGRPGAPDDGTHGETRTAHGLALSPTLAARCLDDYVRTVAFLRGVHDAVREAGAELARPVRVLYAGCGPLAPLAIPLMAVLGPGAVRFTLLDIHAASAASAAGVVATLGLGASLEAVVTADALAYEVDRARPPDVIVTEVMQAALEREPQVAVTRHLVHQAPCARLVPERIDVDVVLVDRARGTRPAVPVGTAFSVDRAAAASWAAGAEVLQGASVRIPDGPFGGFSPTLATRIRTYGPHTLADNASGLTLARPLSACPPPGSRLVFQYALGDTPGLRVRTRGAGVLAAVRRVTRRLLRRAA